MEGLQKLAWFSVVGCLINTVFGDITLGSCSLACNGDEERGNRALDNSHHGLAGPPGKRGVTGLKGSPGIQGAVGPIGRPGIFCDCSYQDDFRNGLETLKSTMKELKLEVKTGETDWHKASNNLYKFYNQTLNYAAAKTYCRDRGSRIASTGWRDAGIRSELRRLYLNQTMYVWIGLDDLDRTDTWMWSDGVVSDKRNTDWGFNEPNRADEHCGAIQTVNEKILDISCHRTFDFVCEIAL